MLELATGRIQAADYHGSQAIALGTRYGHSEIASSGYRVLGDIFYYLGDFNASAEHYSQALIISEDSFLSVDARFRLLGVQLLTARSDDGENQLKDIIEACQKNGLGMVWILANLSLIQAHTLYHNWEAATALGNKIQLEARQRKLASVEWMVSNSLAEGMIERGEHSAAILLCRLTAEAAAQLPQVWIELKARALLSRAARLSEQKNPANQERASYLLAHLQDHSQSDRYKPTFDRFLQIISTELGIAPPAKTR
jgi:hypothetical protein